MKNLKYFLPTFICYLIGLFVTLYPHFAIFLLAALFFGGGTLYAILAATQIQSEFENSRKSNLPATTAQNLTTKQFLLKMTQKALTDKTNNR